MRSKATRLSADGLKCLALILIAAIANAPIHAGMFTCPGEGVALLSELGTEGHGFKIIGEFPGGDTVRWDVSGAGDVNADGVYDLLVGTVRHWNVDNSEAGYAYVVYGNEGPFQTIELANVTSQGAIKISGEEPADAAGSSVSFGGDINGDGISDFLVGAPRRGAGAGYGLYGDAEAPAPLDLQEVASGDGGFLLVGASLGNSYLGWSISFAGDVNADGFDDLIIGAPYNITANDYDAPEGSAYVVFGRAIMPPMLDLDWLAGTAMGFKIVGQYTRNRREQAGWSVSEAGDINGDGIADVLVAARLNDQGGPNAGAAYVVYGRREPQTTVRLDDVATGEGGFKIIGEHGFTGTSVSAAGDINGDGREDIALGASANQGVVYVLFGQDQPFATVNLGELAPGDGIVIGGESAGDHAGSSVAGGGDLNADGFSDLVIGAPGRLPGGAAYVVFGRRNFDPVFLLTDTSNDTGICRIAGEAAGDRAGYSVAIAGDVNADGIDDLAIAAPYHAEGDARKGAAYVVFGTNEAGDPQCSGVSVEITDLAFGDGEFTCTANKDFQTKGPVLLRSGTSVQVMTQRATLRSGFRVEVGAILSVKTRNTSFGLGR